MSMKSMPYDSFQVVDSEGNISYDRPFDSNDWRYFFKMFVGDGVSAIKSNSLQARENKPQGMSIIINPGEIFIQGNVGVQFEEKLVTFEQADNEPRIDRVVVRRDLNTDARNMDIYVKKGTPGASPKAQPLQRDAEIWELALCDVLIGSGVTSISNSKITDTRLNGELCGVVHTLFNQLDTSTINQQYNKWLEEIRAKGLLDLQESKNGFDTFIQTNEDQIRVVLDTKRFATYETFNVSSDSWSLGSDGYYTTSIQVPNLTPQKNASISFGKGISDDEFSIALECVIRVVNQEGDRIRLRAVSQPPTLPFDVVQNF